jgi:hypothetical protein
VKTTAYRKYILDDLGSLANFRNNINKFNHIAIQKAETPCQAAFTNVQFSEHVV